MYCCADPRRTRAALLLLTLGALVGCETPSAAPMATTAVGTFEGVRVDGIDTFLGIRYAQPPVGALRWRPPVPAEAFDGVQPATAFAPPPPQLFDVQETASELPQSEDCLFLNVWSPSTRGSRPVMVFIHGGGWVNGGTADPWYHAERLARRGDIVVVTVGYRLGSFGFLDLSAIGGEGYEQSGNLGILDQQLALRWVHDHIAAFGGDPERVTLAGQSAGGQSVSLHLALPESRPYFQRAIAQSGALSLIRTQATAQNTAQQLLDFAGVTDLAGLQALDTDAVMAAQEALEGSTMFSDLLFGPVLDGALVTEPPMEAILRGDAADIPLLTGTTLDETRYWYFYYRILRGVPPRLGTELLPFLTSVFSDAEREALIVGYETRSPSATPGEITMQLATDGVFRQAQIRLAEAHAQHQPETYMYLFEWATPIQDGIFGSLHSVELPFLFGLAGTAEVEDYVGPNPPDVVTHAIQDAWASFVKGRAPSASALPSWARYDTTRRATMRIDTRSVLEDDPRSAEREAWASVPFDSVRPSL